MKHKNGSRQRCSECAASTEDGSFGVPLSKPLIIPAQEAILDHTHNKSEQRVDVMSRDVRAFDCDDRMPCESLFQITVPACEKAI